MIKLLSANVLAKIPTPINKLVLVNNDAIDINPCRALHQCLPLQHLCLSYVLYATLPVFYKCLCR